MIQFFKILYWRFIYGFGSLLLGMLLFYLTLKVAPNFVDSYFGYFMAFLLVTFLIGFIYPKVGKILTKGYIAGAPVPVSDTFIPLFGGTNLAGKELPRPEQKISIWWLWLVLFLFLFGVIIFIITL